MRIKGVIFEAVLLLLTALTGSVVSAADVRWSNSLSVEERYDDNITQLSKKDLDRLDNQGGGSGFSCGSNSMATSGGRFSITTPDDFITIPRLSSNLFVGWLPDAPTLFGVEVMDYSYRQNDIKTYQSYRAAASQKLPWSQKHSTSFGISYELIPQYYLRNLRSDRTAEELGVLPAPRREVTYQKEEEQAEFGQEIMTSRLWFDGFAGRESRDYNHCFDERDSQMPFREGRLVWDFFGNQRYQLRLSYRREDLHAGGDLSDTPSLVEDDISSRRDIYGGDFRLRWGKRGERKWVRLGYELEHRDYSTTNPNDIFHFGRSDRRRYWTLVARFELKKAWFLIAGAESDSNRSQFPATPASTFQPEDTTDFDENLAYISLGYQFGVGEISRPTVRPPQQPRE